MTNPSFKLLVTSLCLISPCFAKWTTFDSANGANSDDFVVGQILTEKDGTAMANWTLSTTVSSTDFDNLAIHGGEDGVEYVMINQVANSDDVNAIKFTVEPLENTIDVMNHVQITVSQSPYASDLSWNGGDADTSRFFLNWNDAYGRATVVDPENQLSLADGASISSDTLIQFSSNRAYNSVDAWSVRLPKGAAAAEVKWSSSNPQGGSTLTREWISFDTDFAAVPEPSSAGLFLLMAFVMLGFVRQRS